MTIPFFLTRQTANLMEDFARELGSGGALFLLYGENGVGKTRLLQELCHSRFSERKIHWLDLGTGDSADGTRLDYSHGIEDLFGKTGPGDIIVADHFEEALKKTRHQLFLSWSTEGIDKKLDMIIASSNEGFNELRQLSQQYQVRIQSYQLMPFSSDEVESFLCFCLFPDQPAGKLKIPGPVRKQLASTQGNVGKLIEVIERDGKLVKAPQAAESESIRQGSRIIAAVMCLFLLALGAGWYFVSLEQTQFGEPVTLLERAPSDADRMLADAAPAPVEARTEAEAPGQPPLNAAPAATETANQADGAVDQPQNTTPAATEIVDRPGAARPGENETAAESSTVPDDALAAAESAAPSISAAVMPASQDAATGGADTAGTGSTDVETAVVPVAEDSHSGAAPEPPEINADAGAVLDSEAGLVEPGADRQTAEHASVETASLQPLSNWDRFTRDLKSSMQWIRQRETGIGTIQILLLSFDSFDADVYYQYVASLARKQVDTDQLRVFKTLTGNQQVYSVFFGEYDSRRAALQAIERLPKVLRDTSPIPRSVGGIRQEIRRLDAKN